MAREHVTEDRSVQAEDHERASDVRDRPEQFPLWLRTHELQRMLRKRTLKATYAFIASRKIHRRNDGLISRLEVQKALSVPRKKRIPGPASLANLRKRSA